MTKQSKTIRRPLPIALVCCCALLALCVCVGVGTRVADAAPSGDVATPSEPASVVLEDEPIFIIPDGATYVPGKVLVTVPEGMDGTRLAAQLRASGTSTVDPDSTRWIMDGTARLDVAQGSTVEEAVNELLVTGVVKDAQPDYVYYMEDVLPDQAVLEAMAEVASGEGEPAVAALGLVAADEPADLVIEDEPTETLAADSSELVLDVNPDASVDNAGESEPTEDDVLLTAQNSAISDDPYSVFQWSLPSINAPQVWYLAEASPLSKVGVAVLDFGFDINHEDIKNVIAPGSPYNAFRATQGVTDAEQLADVAVGAVSNKNTSYDHGAHVAGIIAAERDNGVGIAGVTNNAQLVPIRVSNYADEPVASSSTIVKSFEYIIENRAKYNIRVINYSFGSKASAPLTADNKVCAQIDKAFAEGIVTVCSVGNGGADGPYLHSPSDWATAVSVINLQNNTYIKNPPIIGELVGYTGATWTNPMDVSRHHTSNYNAPGETTKDISAPGMEIVSATNKTTTKLLGSTTRYKFDSGTSMATPHVTGVLAMMFGKVEVDANSDGAQYMVDKLYEGARHVKEDVPFELEYGHGEVDALGAWNALDTPFVDGPSYVTVGQEGVAYVVGTDKSAANVVTTGWSFSSSDATVLEVDAATGACMPKAVGAAEVLATKGGHTLSKSVTVIGSIVGDDVVMGGSSARYDVEQPSALAWEWNAGDSGSITDSGVLTTGAAATKLTLSATLVATKGTDHEITLSKDVWVLGALTDNDVVRAGGTTTLRLEVPEGFDASGDALAWWSSDEGVATVGTGGVVTGVRAGTATIWVAPREAVSVDESGKTTVADGKCRSTTVTVMDSIARDDIKVASIGNKTYSGSAQKPKPVLTCNGATLAKGVDYTLSYANNVKVGTATITVKGAGFYAGSSRKVTFKIVKAKISSATATAIATQVYTGKAVTPKPKLTFGEKTLKLGTDYTLTYKSNVEAGTAIVVATGTGNFKGTKSIKFKIAAPSVTYRSYVEGSGWQSWVKNGASSGTTGQSKRIEGLKVKVTGLPVSGGITYSAHVQGVGWQDWRSDGAAAGLAGKGKRLEAIKIKLTGDLAKKYDVWYRAHCQQVGWTPWVKNGAAGGTTGRSLRVEAMEVKIVPKGTVVK